MTHGHLYNVNSSIANIMYRGEEVGASMIFYGHTHALGAEMIDGRLILNPGSIVEPRGRYRDRTYAIIESTDDTIRVNFYDNHHRQLIDLEQEFSKK